MISIRGDTLLNRAVEYEPREITRAMERRLADEYAGWMAGDYTSRPMQLLESTLERQRRAYRDAFWVPEYHPPVRQVVAGTDGTIWLLREMREDRVDVWEVYDADGALEGRVEVWTGSQHREALDASHGDRHREPRRDLGNHARRVRRAVPPPVPRRPDVRALVGLSISERRGRDLRYEHTRRFNWHRGKQNVGRLICGIVLLLCAPRVARAQTVCPTPWRLEEVLRIGSAESTDLVTSVRDLAIGPDSALYVAQAQVPAVNVFSVDGQLLRKIGRAGRGPGDIEWSAFGLGWIGDTLWVADRNRIQLFSTDERVPEEVIQFYLSVPEEGSHLTPGRMLADGTVVGARRLSDMRVWSSQGDDPGLALRRISRSGEVLDTIAIMDWPDNAVENESNPG